MKKDRWGFEISDTDNINPVQHKDLINILDELIVIIKLMNPTNHNYFLNQNLREAKDWRRFLKAHTDKEELMSLEEEISERLFYKYNYEAMEDRSELDLKRRHLMHEYIERSWEYIHGYKYKSEPDVFSVPLTKRSIFLYWKNYFRMLMTSSWKNKN